MMCVIRYRAYKLLVIPYDLTNTPTIFCTIVNKIFYLFMDEFVVVYLDDAIMYNNTLEEYVEYLKKVFEIL